MPKKIVRETVEQFLARGGRIKKIGRKEVEEAIRESRKPQKRTIPLFSEAERDRRRAARWQEEIPERPRVVDPEAVKADQRARSMRYLERKRRAELERGLQDPNPFRRAEAQARYNETKWRNHQGLLKVGKREVNRFLRDKKSQFIDALEKMGL